MIRQGFLVTAVSLCMAAILASMAALSVMLWRMDIQRRAAREQERYEQQVALALWRMEGVATLIVNEQAVVPADRFEGNDANVSASEAGFLKHRYELIERGGKAATADARAEAIGAWLDQQLDTRQPATNGVPAVASTALHNAGQADTPLQQAQAEASLPQQSATMPQQALNGFNEYGNRALLANQQRLNNADNYLSNYRADLPATMVSVMLPRVNGHGLELVRRVETVGSTRLQVAQLNTAAVERALTDAVQDLLPEAEVILLKSPQEAPEARRLASLPMAIQPGPLAASAVLSDPSSVLGPILVGWGVVVVGLLVAVLGVISVVRLSQRRASFVAAVTHEMRTPLTTFQMYTEMLTEGMVNDPAQRDHYLQTLRSQSIRLGHLVENVLSYARLEHKRAAESLQSPTVDQLLQRCLPRLRDRAGIDDMMVEVDCGDPDRDITVGASPALVEQVLFNLVDNSCKYACAAEDRRILVRVGREDSRLNIDVIDQGPGVQENVRQLFRAFSRSIERERAASPGVGLGLALSRSLARSVGGDLRLIQSPSGARFRLSLPVSGLHPSDG